ncbi:MAG: tyrosine-type recombinase/integrase [Methanosarcina sp.]
MAAKAKGEVIETDLKGGRSFALRFPAYGDRPYVTLGFDHEGWTPESAQDKLEDILAEVRLGMWVPPKKKRRRREADVVAPADEPSDEIVYFGPFAVDLVKSRKGQVSEGTTSGEEWALGHLLPFFGDWPLPEIDAEAVDDYREFKVRESEARARAIERRRPQRNDRNQILKPLSPRTINKTINALQFILGVALERKRKTGVTENAAAGKKRRLKLPPKRPVHLDTAGQIEALVEAAAAMDRDPLMRGAQRQAILSTLIFAGPRAHELCNLLWRDVDLANGRIFIGRSKTQAGLREIPLLPVLRDVIAAHKAATYQGDPDAHVFLNAKGGVLNKDTLRSGVLVAAFARADELLRSRGQIPLPVGLTAHKLRHTFASVLVAIGEDPASVMRQLGHKDAAFTLEVYTHLMNRDPEERSRLKALVKGERVAAQLAPLPTQLESTDYELPIMRALIDRGGAAAAREIIAAVGEEMAPRHSTSDIEALPSGAPRWEARARKARSRLVERAWVKANSPRGRWEVTKVGRAKVRRDEQKANRGRRLRSIPVAAAEPELAVAA